METYIIIDRTYHTTFLRLFRQLFCLSVLKTQRLLTQYIFPMLQQHHYHIIMEIRWRAYMNRPDLICQQKGTVTPPFFNLILCCKCFRLFLIHIHNRRNIYPRCQQCFRMHVCNITRPPDCCLHHLAPPMYSFSIPVIPEFLLPSPERFRKLLRCLPADSPVHSA